VGLRAIIALFAVAVLAAIALVVLESRRREPLVDMRYFHSAPFSGAALIGVVALATLGGFLFLNTLYLQDVRGYSALQAGLLTIPIGRDARRVLHRLRPVDSPPWAQARSDRVRRTDHRGRDPADRPYRPHRAVVSDRRLPHLRCRGGLVSAPITNTALSGMPRDQAGVAGAIASTCRQTGAALGVAVTGAIIATSSAGFVHASHAAWAVVRRLWSDGHRARHGLDRTLGAGDRRAKRRAPGH